MNVVDESALKYLGRCQECRKHLYLENCNAARQEQFRPETPATGPVWLQHVKGVAWEGPITIAKVWCLECKAPLQSARVLEQSRPHYFFSFYEHVLGRPVVKP